LAKNKVFKILIKTAMTYSSAQYMRLIAILHNAREHTEILTQELPDDFYSQMVSYIIKYSQGTGNACQTKKQKGNLCAKHKKKRYMYAHTQELYKKNPSTLAKYIREGVPWLEDQILMSR
jgi:hypothetical protein